MMKRLIVAMAVCAAALWSFADGSVVVKSVTAQQRYPWNGLVDIAVPMEGAADEVAEADCLFAATNCETGVALPVTSITRKDSDTGSGNNWTRRFVWDAAADIGTIKIDDVALSVDAKVFGGVQLWENGPYWAECNVGASKPEAYGYYFWWGDTVGYVLNAGGNGWVSVKDGSGFSFYYRNCPTCDKDNSALQSAGYIDSTGNLVAAHDAATAHLGAPWRMPTDAEFSALIRNCTSKWVNRGGHYGKLYTGKGAYASKSIFLPAAGYGFESDFGLREEYGYYWSSSPYLGYSRHVVFDSRSTSCNYDNRWYGRSIRPLRGFADGTTVSVLAGETAHLKLDCRTGTRACSADGESLHYNARWYENGSEVRITDNGTLVMTGTTGCYAWRPEPSCFVNHELKLEILSGGLVVGTETTQFRDESPAWDHTMVISRPAVEPTSSTPGSTAEIRCSRCNELMQAVEVIPALGYVRNVTARQLWPHKKVEVCYVVVDDIGEVGGCGRTATVKSSSGHVARTLMGDTSCTPGLHRVVWDMEADGVKVKAEDVKFTVEYGN